MPLGDKVLHWDAQTGYYYEEPTSPGLKFSPSVVELHEYLGGDKPVNFHNSPSVSDFLSFGNLGGTYDGVKPSYVKKSVIKTSVVDSTKAELEDNKLEMDINRTKLFQIIKSYSELATLPDVNAAFNLFINHCKVADIAVPEVMSLKYPVFGENPNVAVGIEIEIEKFETKHLTTKLQTLQSQLHNLVCQFWVFSTDDSLRNHGQELISKPGLLAHQVPKALAILRAYLELFYPNVDLNPRCGTHVHLNVREFTVGQFINLTLLYILFEDTLYQVSGNRYRNIFCVPLRASSSEVERLFKLIHREKPTYEHFRSTFNSFKKYMAYNLLPAAKTSEKHPALGTVEFRHHKGESHPVVLSRWVRLLTDLHALAQKYTTKELLQVLFELNTVSNYMQFVEMTFGSDLPASKVSQDKVINDMYEGSSFIKELYIMAKDAS